MLLSGVYNVIFSQLKDFVCIWVIFLDTILSKQIIIAEVYGTVRYSEHQTAYWNGGHWWTLSGRFDYLEELEEALSRTKK